MRYNLFQKKSYFSEDVDHEYDKNVETVVVVNIKISYWPSPSKRSMPEWLAKQPKIDKELDALLQEVYTALNNDLKTLAAIGIRTVFDKATELLHVDAGKTFKDKMNDLVVKHLIG